MSSSRCSIIHRGKFSNKATGNVVIFQDGVYFWNIQLPAYNKQLATGTSIRLCAPLSRLFASWRIDGVRSKDSVIIPTWYRYLEVFRGYRLSVALLQIYPSSELPGHRIPGWSDTTIA